MYVCINTNRRTEREYYILMGEVIYLIRRLYTHYCAYMIYVRLNLIESVYRRYMCIYKRYKWPSGVLEREWTTDKETRKIPTRRMNNI